MSELPRKAKVDRSPRLVGLAYAAGIGATALVSLAIVGIASRRVLLQDLRNYLRRTAETASASLDGDQVAAFRDSSQTGTAEYANASRPLRTLLQSNPDIRYAYVGRLRGDSMFYVLDGDQTGDPAYVMEPDVPTGGERQVWETRQTVVEGQPSRTAWGEGIRAYAPVYDRQRRMVGYVGVTMSAHNYRLWIQHVSEATLAAVAVAVALATLAGFGVARTERARSVAELEILRAKDLADAATRAKSQFVANMSHEIRTPMNGVLGFAELLAASPLDDQQRLYVETVRRSAGSLLTVVDDVLELSTIEAGRMTVERAPFAVDAVLLDVVGSLKAVAAERGISLHVDKMLGPDCPVMGDAGRVRHILLKLVGNAIKFTERGTVRLTATRMASDRSGIRFAVVDTGIGIAPEQLDQIFGDFIQADGSMARRFGGIGLGLAISKRLAELMGGSIGVDSRLGVGSTFWLLLPLEPMPGAAIAD